MEDRNERARLHAVEEDLRRARGLRKNASEVVRRQDEGEKGFDRYYRPVLLALYQGLGISRPPHLRK